MGSGDAMTRTVGDWIPILAMLEYVEISGRAGWRQKVSAVDSDGVMNAICITAAHLSGLGKLYPHFMSDTVYSLFSFLSQLPRPSPREPPHLCQLLLLPPLLSPWTPSLMLFLPLLFPWKFSSVLTWPFFLEHSFLAFSSSTCTSKPRHARLVPKMH